MTPSQRNALVFSGIFLGVLLIAYVFAASKGLFVSHMKLTSSAFVEGGFIPAAYTCDGEGKTPPLTFSNVPKDARSIVLYVFDPDAPSGGFVHWVTFNINPLTKEMEEGKKVPDSLEGLNGAKKIGYYPLCPPSGTHRYQFVAYAMNTSFGFQKAPDLAALKKVMKWKVLDKAELTAKYARTK